MMGKLRDRAAEKDPDTSLPAFECVIPAAGYSSRMGALKPLVSFRGRPLLFAAITNAAIVCDRIILVTGFRREPIQEAIDGDDRFQRVESSGAAMTYTAPIGRGGRTVEILVVVNDEYDRGMISSIARGALFVTGGWFFIAPGDMPTIDPAVFRFLSAAVSAVSSDTRAIFPVWNERRGHPVLVDRRVVPDLLSRYREVESMRAFLGEYRMYEVEVEAVGIAKGIFADIDTPEDLARIE